MIKPALIAMLLTNMVLIPLASAQMPMQLGETVVSPLRGVSVGDPLRVDPELIEASVLETKFIEPVPTLGLEPIAGPAFETSPVWNDSAIDGWSPTMGMISCDGNCLDGTTCGGGCNRSEMVSSQWTPWQNLSLAPLASRFDKLMVGKNFAQGRTRDRGIGYERVMFAPNVLDTAIQTPHVGIQYKVDYGLNTPDRAEYYWGQRDQTNAETGLNAQDISVRLAIGNEKAMALTQYTMRSLDPEINGNTTGFGDMVIGAQALLVDGKRTKVATIFRTYLATGPVQRGLGTGHTSLEYGLLARQCLRPETYFFAELKYWNPIKGTDGIAGDVLSTGWGISTIAAESDVFALLPTFEIRTLSFLFGGQNATSATVFDPIDGETAVEFYPGARLVLGPESDAGLWEIGFAAGFTAFDDDWFDARFVLDARLAF